MKQCCTDTRHQVVNKMHSYFWFDLISNLFLSLSPVEPNSLLVHKAHRTVNYTESMRDLRPIMFSSALLTTARQYTSSLCKMIREGTSYQLYVHPQS